jgi:hypothetical protein
MKILQSAVEQYQSYSDKIEHPPCFNSSEDYTIWSRLEDLCHTQPIRKFICRDCTRSYQKEMIQKNRCIISKISVTQITRD